MTVGRAWAKKYLLLAHMWALLGLGRIVMAGRGGGTAAWLPNWAHIFGAGHYNPASANKGGYGGLSDGDAMDGGQGIKCRAKGTEDGGGDRATLAAEILRQ